MTTSENITQDLKETFAVALHEAFEPLRDSIPEDKRPEFDKLLDPMVTRTSNPKFGDYQCTNAMTLFKFLKGALPADQAPKSPKEVAASIIAKIPKRDTPFIKDASAPSGFINITLEDDFIASLIDFVIRQPLYAPPPPRVEKQHVAVDFSSPNIAKSMHVGHLRSTIIGDTISRLLELCGCEVERINHVGDWGTQFGMLLAHLEDSVGDGEIPPISDLVELYKDAKKRFDEDEEFKHRAHLKVVGLQSGQPRERELWQAICDASRKEFQEIYDLLEVKLTEVGESFYNPMLPSVCEFFEQKGLSEISDGALIMWCKNVPATHPLILRKRDGAYNYDTTDMAAIRYRIQDLKCDRLIYITDSGQNSHFELVFEGARMAGWIKHDPITEKDTPRVEHIGFGLVCGADGKKFKTRSGETVKLRDLLLEAVRRSREQLVERGRSEEFSEEEMDHISRVVGLGAVKYADLSGLLTRNYIFDYDRMLSLKGNTAAYLLYCYARIASIMRKAGVEPDKVEFPPITGKNIETPYDRALALHIARYPEVIAMFYDDLLPHRLGDYLYRLSEVFMNFYENCRVIGTDGKPDFARLALCACTRGIMRQGLWILGINTVEKM